MHRRTSCQRWRRALRLLLLPLALALVLVRGETPKLSASAGQGGDEYRLKKESTNGARSRREAAGDRQQQYTRSKKSGGVHQNSRQDELLGSSGSTALGTHPAAAPILEFGRLEMDEEPVDEPPAMTHIHEDWVHRCSTLNQTNFHHGASCGTPLSEPCFHRSRCRGTGAPKIYVYDKACTLADSHQLPIQNHTGDDRQHQSSYWREAAWRAGMLADTYEEACVFVHVNTHNHDEPCATRAPLWNGGANHVMMEFTPWWQEILHRPSISNTYAMDWAFDSLSCYYRTGFDLSLPLVSNVVFPDLGRVRATKRKYFLTFKGSIYLGGPGTEERSAVSRVHNPADGIVSVVKCSNMHGEEFEPENLAYCARARESYTLYGYGELMNTTFALVPGGRSPGSFRLGEVMSAGAIPVFVARDWVKPFQEYVQWSTFSFTFAPEQVGPEMIEVLRAVSETQLKKMQRKSLDAYWEIFGGVTDYSVIAGNTIEILRQRLGFH